MASKLFEEASGLKLSEISQEQKLTMHRRLSELIIDCLFDSTTDSEVRRKALDWLLANLDNDETVNDVLFRKFDEILSEELCEFENHDKIPVM